MGKNGIQVCRQIMSMFAAVGATEGQTLNPKALDAVIGEQAGIDNRTMSKYRKALVDMGFVKKDKHGHPVIVHF